jgi:hypothetical protein
MTTISPLKTYNVVFSTPSTGQPTLTQQLPLAGNNASITLDYQLTTPIIPPTTPTTIVLNIIKNNVDFSVGQIAINTTDTSISSGPIYLNITMPTLNNVITTIFSDLIVPSDTITISFDKNKPSVSHGANSVINNLSARFGLSGPNTPSLTNKLLTENQISANIPTILNDYLDSPISNNLGGNRIVTTDNLEADLDQYLVSGQLSNTNKLITTQGTANLITTFFGTISSNPGIIASTASGIINNNNLISISLSNGSTISLIESISLPSSRFNLYTYDDATYTQITDFNSLFLTTSAVLRIVLDFENENSTISQSVTVSGNLIGNIVSTATSSDLSYGLISGSLFTSTYKPGTSQQRLSLEFVDPGATYSTASGDIISLTSGYLIYQPTTPIVGALTNFVFPCTAYGVITSFNDGASTDQSNPNYNPTVPATTDPPVIINTLLPLYTELATAAGLVYRNQFDKLYELLAALKANIGNLDILTNYLQAHSENIYVVGEYTSTITINGNAIPIGTSYYNPNLINHTTTPPTGWVSKYYSPAAYTWTYPTTSSQSTTPTIPANIQEITGTNSSDNLTFVDENGNRTHANLYPMINTIIVPSNYAGYGTISPLAGRQCTPFPTYMLSINLNNLIIPPTQLNSTSGIDTTEFSNGASIKSGTQIQIYNESNFNIQLTSRNFTYGNPIDIKNLSVLNPTPSMPYNIFTNPLNPLEQNRPVPDGWAPLVSPNNNSPTFNPINLRDTTSEIIYVRANDSIKLIYTDDNNGSGGNWGYL